ncbi:MAG: hypothetical protein JWO88_3800 [Frankiales bacterium]|nr:hypothetical protein [Frankiales bacterium]
MKTSLLVSIASIACAAASLAAEGEDSTQFQVYPKNLARQHLGTNLLQYNTTTHMFTPTQAAAAWLDDDVTTGWPLMAEKQYYLVTLQRAELLTNFSLSMRPSTGTISIYASNTAEAPGSKAWQPLLKDAPLDTVNQKLSRDFSKVAKFVLIETEVPDPGPVYSIYLYSHKPAVSYNVQRRERAINSRDVFGPYVNEATSLNSAGLYAHSIVAQSGTSTDAVSLQRAIDDNPETSIAISPSLDKPTIIRYDQPRMVSRVALLGDPGAKGKIDLYLTGLETSLQGATPTMTMVLDGTTPRTSVDFPATQASEVRLVWTPTNGTDRLTVREINTFGDTTLSSYAVNATAGTPAAVADNDGTGSNGRSGKDSVDGKDAKDNKAEPVAMGPSNPYLPGALGFPPTFGTAFRTIPRSN